MIDAVSSSGRLSAELVALRLSFVLELVIRARGPRSSGERCLVRRSWWSEFARGDWFARTLAPRWSRVVRAFSASEKSRKDFEQAAVSCSRPAVLV